MGNPKPGGDCSWQRKEASSIRRKRRTHTSKEATVSNKTLQQPLWQSEDWWACFLGWFILVAAMIGLKEVEAGKWAVQLLPEGPKIGKNWTTLAAIFPRGWATIGAAVTMFLFLAVITSIGGFFMKLDFKRYLPGFFFIYLLAYLALILSSQKFINTWGIKRKSATWWPGCWSVRSF
jgi:hypothetical protein